VHTTETSVQGSFSFSWLLRVVINIVVGGVLVVYSLQLVFLGTAQEEGDAPGSQPADGDDDDGDGDVGLAPATPTRMTTAMTNREWANTKAPQKMAAVSEWLENLALANTPRESTSP
jgi:hypothetical protein